MLSLVCILKKPPIQTGVGQVTLLTACRAGGGRQARYLRGRIGVLGGNAMAAKAALVRPAALIKAPQAIILNMPTFSFFVFKMQLKSNGMSL